MGCKDFKYLLVLLFCVSLVRCEEFSYTFSGTLNAETVIIQGPFTIPTLSNGGLLNVEATSDDVIQLCFGQDVSPPQNVHSWKQQSCDYYLDLRRVSTGEVYVGAGVFYLAVVAQDTTTFNVTLSGEICPPNFIGQDCSTRVTSLGTVFNNSFPVTVNSKSWSYYYLTVPFNTYDYNIETLEKSPIAIYARAGNIPVLSGQFQSTGNIYEFSSTQQNEKVHLEFIDPGFGSYYLAIYNNGTSAVTMTFNVTKRDVCTYTATGYGCETPVTSLNNYVSDGSITKSFELGSQVHYYALNIKDPQVTELRLSVGVLPSADGAVSLPQMFLRYGNVAASDKFDIDNCNLQSCADSVVTMVTFIPHTGPYYLTVYATAPDQTYTLWVDSTCPSNCQGNGECSKEGICHCYEFYFGIECQHYASDEAGKLGAVIGSVVGAIAFWVAVAIGTSYYYKKKRARRGSGYHPINH